MMRFLGLLLAFILVVPLIRMVAGLVGRWFMDLAAGPKPKRGPAAAGGQLHRDPVCGTYVSEAVAVQETVQGQVVYFCSQECADKHRQGGA